MNIAFRSFLVVGLLTVWLQANSPAQGSDVAVLCSKGQNIRGELLVATDSAVIVKTDSSIRNMWWQGDSAFAILLPLSGIETIVVEGHSNILIGTGMGVVLGAGLGAATAEKGWEGAGAAVGGLLGGFGGGIIGALASHRDKVYDHGTRGGFVGLSDLARYGSTTPKTLKHIK